MTLTPRLKDVRKEIRSINEKLGKFAEHEIPHQSLRNVLLRAHHEPVFAMIQELSDEIFDRDQNAVANEVMKFIKARNLSMQQDWISCCWPGCKGGEA